MELITYRKTLDVHKNGTQFVLRGFETSEKLSRIVEISLMASGDAIDFPLENIMALMYISSPGSEIPTIKECEIKDNKIICEVSPLVTEGISTVQISLMETSPSGASSVLYTPKFNIEVTKSIVNDTALEQNSDFGILKNAISAAKTVYDQRFLRMELTNDCIFKAYYADGSWYETDILKKLFHNGNVLLSESFAHGNTGTRIGEDTDNAMYYSNLAKSEALNAKEILAESEGVLNEVRQQGVYTAFTLDFNTGKIEYVSPSFAFEVNTDTGNLDVIGQSYSFSEEIYRLIAMWLAQNGVVLSDLEKISTTHTEEIGSLMSATKHHATSIEKIEGGTPVEWGGTGAKTAEDARKNLDVPSISEMQSYQSPWSLDENVDMICLEKKRIEVSASYNDGRQGVRLDLPLINSGKLRIAITNCLLENNMKVNEFSVLINNETKKELQLNEDSETSFDIDIEVKKGDTVTIFVVVSSRAVNTPNVANKMRFDIELKANIVTPYKYFKFPEVTYFEQK